MTVKIGIIGAGIMGADHARIFVEEVPGVEVTMICDATAERAEQVASRLDIATVQTDPEALIADTDVEAVVIASTDETHAPLTLSALRVGKKVLCEKPLAHSVEECRSVIEAEVALGRKMVQIGFMRRYDPSYVEMKSALDDGLLGPAMMMHNFHRNVTSPGAWFTGEMAITNSASHEFDVARYVLGSDYKSVSVFQPKRSDDMVAPVMIVLETDQGQIVNIEINNNAAYGYDVRGELVGETGSVSLNAGPGAAYNLALKGYTAYAADWRKRFQEAYRRQNADFVHFVATGEFSNIASDVWDGYCATMAGLAGAKALREGRPVNIEFMPKPALYR
ncbi:Gfo/Idh/MocA family oxidoreductase [Celeribacter sp.]|uniref:Gfo/Idh/MocA family oxidoreductase n=1 Tax=Celeribacter sp. TaxID=1890673 RepID=UPI003A8F5620